MKKTKNDPLKSKASYGTYFLCLFLALLSCLTAFAFWLLIGLDISFNSGYTTSYLESDNFIARHQDEHLIIRLSHYVQNFLSENFWILFLILFVLCIIFIILMWFASKKNSYVFMKFQSAVTVLSGLLMLLLPAGILLMNIPGLVKLVNHQNTLLFSAFIKSSCFILIAIGILLLAVAFAEEFLAATILKNRKNSYLRKMEKSYDENIDM